jgi:hypothetical protein
MPTSSPWVPAPHSSCTPWPWKVAIAALHLVSLAAIGCGGEQSAATDGDLAPPYDPCEDSSQLQKVMVADFESTLPVNGFTGSDGTVPDTQLSPVPTAMPASPLEANKCAADTSPGSGLHIVATGLTGYGYTFGFNGLNQLPGAVGATYFDTTGWDGISMWVRKGTGPSSSSIFASVAERFTDPAGAGLFAPSEAELLLDTGAYCAFNASDVTGDQVSDPLLTQCDRFGVGIGISTEWRFFKVPFARMRQRAYGRPSTEPTPDPKILELDFGLDGPNWDFWIDELAFYRDPD